MCGYRLIGAYCHALFIAGLTPSPAPVAEWQTTETASLPCSSVVAHTVGQKNPWFEERLFPGSGAVRNVMVTDALPGLHSLPRMIADESDDAARLRFLERIWPDSGNCSCLLETNLAGRSVGTSAGCAYVFGL